MKLFLSSFISLQQMQMLVSVKLLCAAQQNTSPPSHSGRRELTVFDQDLPVGESPPAGLYTHTHSFFTLATKKGPAAGANANER